MQLFRELEGLAPVNRLTTPVCCFCLINGRFSRRFAFFEMSIGKRAFVISFLPYRIEFDAMKSSNGYRFSTCDKEFDIHANNCAVWKAGAWWYRRCSYANLNGDYSAGEYSKKCVRWLNYPSSERMKRTEMMVRCDG